MADDQTASGQVPRAKWTLGILNTPDNDHVPGSVVLLAKTPDEEHSVDVQAEAISSLKTTPDGKIVLEPQPDDSPNDPLLWAVWKRNAALFSLGFYCMLGGGVTPILAAGFQDVALSLHTPLDTVAMTTGMVMLGLGVGGVLISPTAIIYGKRTIYLSTATVFLCACIWCAKAASFTSLLLARFVQGMALSPIEVMPSASISELFYLHERAFRLGIYTLLLLSGKNLIPLVSAVVINVEGWRWVFWILSIATAAAIVLMFFFLPETFWDRNSVSTGGASEINDSSTTNTTTPSTERPKANVDDVLHTRDSDLSEGQSPIDDYNEKTSNTDTISNTDADKGLHDHSAIDSSASQTDEEKTGTAQRFEPIPSRPKSGPIRIADSRIKEQENVSYTEFWRCAPTKTYRQSLGMSLGRLSDDRWLVAAARPFALFTYPAVLWSAMVYSLSIGWLIVLSESVSEIYRSRHTYSFTSFQAGLVYLSPFVGAVFGTALAGKCSDYIVQFMARKNGGIYEPEFRLVMAVPVAITTAIGLMGFGWSVEQKDAWIVPTVFFGVISFGCSLGSTTAITFVVDSYKQYAAEALVTLNFSKNIFHGFVFSLFFPHWLQSKGGKPVFIVLGSVHLICMLFTIPMYIYGKRARRWTAQNALVDRIADFRLDKH